MIHAVIFDLDGLLIDSEVISYKIYKDLLAEYGYEFSIEDYGRNYSGKTSIGNMGALIKRFELPIDTEEGLQKTEEIEKEYFKRGVDLKEGAVDLLKYLKNHQYKIALATSSTKERALDVLRFYHIEDYFDEMVFGYEVKLGKPNPDIFLKACEKVNELPEDCLVLEDSEAGIQAAYYAHIPVICVPDMKEPGKQFEEMTECMVSSLLKVISYMELDRTGKRILA